MAKKYITDQILPNDSADITVVQSAMSSILQTMLETEGARFSEEGLPIVSNIPQELETAGALDNLVQWTIDQDEAGNTSFIVSDEAIASFTLNTIVSIAVWSDESVGLVHRDGEEPLKRLEAIYFLALPTIEKLRMDPKLRQYMDDLLGRDLIAKARSIAKKSQAGADGFTLVVDPVGMFLAAKTTSSSREAAYGKIFLWLQSYMLTAAQKTVDALKARGDNANAGYVKATYSKSRLSRDTLKACLSSQESAEHYFPNMVNKDESKGPRGVQWDNILRKLMERAPKHKVARLVKDHNGEKVLDANGKAEREFIPMPVSPAIFSYWLENRYNAPDAVEQAGDVIPDFGDVSVG